MTKHGTAEQWIAADEGFRQHWYDDATGQRLPPHPACAGHPTIGHGINLDGGLTEEESLAVLRFRVHALHGELRNGEHGSIFMGLPDEVQDAVLNMAYNMGTPRLRFFRKMWTAMRRMDWDVAAAEALDSRWARQVPKRAERVADVIRNWKAHRDEAERQVKH